MMTKNFSRFRSVIYSLVMIPILILLVSCFGEYEYIRGQGLINITDDYLTVDFNGMNQNQLSEAQTKLMDYNIDLEFTTSTFDETGKLDGVAFDVSYPNGNSGSASFSCSSLNFPFGLWYDIEDGSSGTGHLDDPQFYHFKKATFERASQVNDANGEFYLNGHKTDFITTNHWIIKARESFQSTFSCDTILGTNTLSLESF